MLNDIKEKLRVELAKPIKEESQIIYILSRVRKILELDEATNQGKYKKLKFYCDWSLHSKIEKGTKPFQEEFEKFVQGDMESGSAVLTFQFFDKEFIAFLKQYEISSELYKTLVYNLAFKKLLAKIYSDTPLIVTLEKKFEIKTNSGLFTTSPDQTKMEIGFQITPLE